MVTLIFSCLILCVFLLIPLKYFFHNKNRNGHDPNKKLPPGKTGWPLVGETWTYLSMAKRDKIYQFIADRKLKYSSPKIFRTSLLGEDMAIMCSPEGNKFLFSNENKLVQTWWPTSFKNLFNPFSDPDFSLISKTDRHQYVLSYLRLDSIQKYIGTMDSLTKKNLELHWADQDIVKARELVLHYVFVSTCTLFLSVDDPELIARLEKQHNHIAAGIISVPIDLPGSKFRRAKWAAAEFCREMVAMIEKQKKNCDSAESSGSGSTAGKENLLTNLLNYTDEDGKSMTERQVATKLLGFMFPATDTTSTTIVSVIHYLAQLPELYDLVLKEQMEIANSKAPGELLNWEDVRKMTYSWNVVKETLRLLPSAQGGYREALTDFHYEGYYIPKGWKIHWNPYGLQRNPEYFSDPETFDPSRFEGKGPIPYSFVPFGGGPRMCPGNEFARAQILVFIHNLVTKFKWEKVFPDEKIVCDPVLAPSKGLPLRLYPHRR